MERLTTNTLQAVRLRQHNVSLVPMEPATATGHGPRLAGRILYVSVSLCILDGAIRKWLLRDFVGLLQYAPYFGKDIALVAIVFFCKRPPGQSASAAPFLRYLQVGVTLGAAGAVASLVANWNALNLVGAGLTIRSLLFLPVVSYICVGKLRGLNLEKLAMLLGFFTLLNAGLGTFQYSSPIDDPINYYASKQYVAVAFEENVRAMGTFPYITGFGTMAMVGAWAGTTLLGYGMKRKLYFWLGILVCSASIWSALLSISRAAVIVVLGIFVVWLFSARQILANLMRVAGALIALSVILIISDRFSLIQRASDVLMARNEAAGDTFEERVLFPVTDTFEAISSAPFGVGFGSEQVAGVFAETGVMSFRQFEAQFPRIVMETGLMGLCGFAVLYAGVMITLYTASRRVSSIALKRSIMAGLFLVGSLMFINVAFDHVASFFTWTLVAVLLAAADGHEESGVSAPVAELPDPGGSV